MALRDEAQPRRRWRRRRLVSEINVTPFVDVMLVLLVVFMITAPLLTVGVKVNLPETKARVITGDDEPLIVAVDAEGKIFVQKTPIELDGLSPLLTAVTDNRPDTRIFVHGDQDIEYGRVLEVIGEIDAAGFAKFSLISELPGRKVKN